MGQKSKKKPNSLIFAAIILILAVSFLFAIKVLNGSSKKSSPPFDNLEGPCPVVRVIDGDTIEVNRDGYDTKIRLIGIDAPESVHPDAEKNTEEGRIASEYVEKLLSGKNVYLEYDSEYKDAYDRVLAYVYLEDGSMVNELLLEEGMAVVYTMAPNTRYAARFLSSQKKARENRCGFWGE